MARKLRVAWDWIWAWAGLVDNVRGRVGVLLGVVGLTIGGTLLLLRALGVVNTVLAIVGGVAILVGVFLLTTILRSTSEPSEAAVFPDVEFAMGGIGAEVTTTPPSMPESFRRKHPDFEVKGMLVKLLNVRITNHEADRAASLTFKMSGKTAPGEFVEELQLDRVPALGPPFLSMPVDVPPQRGAGGDIAFYNSGLVKWGDGGWLVKVEDHLSGLSTALPTMGTWRPAKDGEWTGAFPPPEAELPTQPAIPQRRLGNEGDDLELVIEEEEFEPFEYKALFVKVRIRLKNHTGKTKHAMALTWRAAGEWGQFPMHHIEIGPELYRIRNALPQLQSVLGPHEVQTFWAVHPFPWRPGAGEPEYVVAVKDELGHEYGVTRFGKPAKTYWRLGTLFGKNPPKPDDNPFRDQG